MASGMACYHHPSQQAVAECKVCGKGICKNCNDVYGFTSGEYAGNALCYECTTALIAENAVDVDAFRELVKKERKWMIIGAIFGLIAIAPIFMTVMEMSPPLAFLLGPFVGSSLGTIFKRIKEAFAGDSDNIVFAVIVALFMIFVSPIITIYRFVIRLKQIKQAGEIISTDERILQEMSDYFAYTQTLEKNTGVDLANLAGEGGELFNNTYAQSVLKNGEKAAQAELQQSVVTISANSETIRNFDKKTKN